MASTSNGMDLLHDVTLSREPEGSRTGIWFDCGRWWCRPHPESAIENLSELMRRKSYDIREIAKALGFGRRAFERVVAASIGLTPGVWLRQERAVMSRYRLREGCSIKELAFELGFGHPGDFSAEFKRWHGVTPASFRMASASRAFPE